MSLHKSALPTVIVLLAAIGTPVLAQNPCVEREVYPVIVYDAATRTPGIGIGENGVIVVPPPAPPGLGLQRFLCDGKPVEIHVINRKLLSSYSATLTTTFTVPNKLLDLRGATPPPAQPPSNGNTPPPSAPAAHGLTLPALNTSLLTTDKAVGYLLDDETFDIPFNQVSDHAAAVREQFAQLQANLNLYNAYLATLNGPVAGTPLPPQGEITLSDLTAEWQALSAIVPAPPAPVTEAQFKAWINQADRLITETSRMNTKLQQFPVVDSAVNLAASLTTIQDNFRAVQDEEDELQEAVRLIQAMGNEYRMIRAKNELTNTLRAHLTANTTIPDATLLRIIEAFEADEHRPGHPPLKVVSLGAGGICPAGAPPAFPPLVRYCGFRTTEGLFAGSLAASGTNWAPLQENLVNLNNLIVAANNAQGAALQALNNVYDNTIVPGAQIVDLNLGGASGNLVVYYTLALNEQFNRYQVVNEIAEPVSNCQLTLSAAATSATAAGFVPCTTAATSTPPAPATTLSASGYPPLQPMPPTGSSAPTAPTVSVSNPQAFFGRVEVHHFSHGALVTGVAYDSVKQMTFSWLTCPTNATYLTGNPSGLTGTTISPPPSSGPCASPTTVPSGATTAPTYYQLQPTSGPTVAVVEGVDLFIFDNFRLRNWMQGGARDMFASRMVLSRPELYLAASAYPVNHYFLGLSEEPLQGFHFSGGISGAVQSSISRSSGFTVGTVSLSNSAIPTTSHFKHGYFIEVGFDTSLFGQIFSKNAFSSVLSLGSAGGVAQTAASTSP